MTSIRDTDLTLLDGSTTTLGDLAAGRAILIVNVASKCGLTPQYAGLEEIAREYQDRDLIVIGTPCNQFGGQEPGTNEEIAEFCSTTYGVTFPLTDKLEVNGDGQHPLFAQLTTIEDAEGHSGQVRWNFEKWLIGKDDSITRFSPQVEPVSAKWSTQSRPPSRNQPLGARESLDRRSAPARSAITASKTKVGPIQKDGPHL